MVDDVMEKTCILPKRPPNGHRNGMRPAK